MTDLSIANRTVFISIFSVTLSAETPMGKVNGLWAGCAVIRIWRIFLSEAFSLPAVRRAYGRYTAHCQPCYRRRGGCLRSRLLYEGVTHRYVCPVAFATGR